MTLKWIGNGSLRGGEYCSSEMVWPKCVLEWAFQNAARNGENRFRTKSTCKLQGQGSASLELGGSWIIPFGAIITKGSPHGKIPRLLTKGKNFSKSLCGKNVF